jgi:hypothetical protein
MTMKILLLILVNILILNIKKQYGSIETKNELNKSSIFEALKSTIISKLESEK